MIGQSSVCHQAPRLRSFQLKLSGLEPVFRRRGFAVLFLMSALALSGNVRGDLASGLVGHWKLNEPSGSLAPDASGNNNHGILMDGPVWTAGRFDGGLQFDGVDDYVEVADAPSLNPTSALTLAAWFKSENIAAGAMLVSKGANGTQYNLRAFASSLRFRVNVDRVISDLEVSYPFMNGVWYHVAGVYDGSIMQVFINGSPVGNTLSRPGTLSADTEGVAVGKRSGSTLNFFNGILDEVRIYSRALSRDEIAALASLTDPRIPPGLVGHWRLNDPSGLRASDASGYNNDGLLQNNPVWSAGKIGGGLRFDGMDDYVEVADAPPLNPTSALTLAAWFKSENIAAGAMLVSKGANGTQYNLREFANSIRFRVKTSGVINDLEVSHPFANGVWYHVAGVYDGSTMQVFVNGAPVGNPLARNGPISPDPIGITLGKRSGSDLNFFNGILDDVRIYNQALSRNEIAALANLMDDLPLAPLKITSLQPQAGDQIKLTLSIPAGRDCSVLFAPALLGSVWTPLMSFPAAPTNRTLDALAPAPAPIGFYRLRSP